MRRLLCVLAAIVLIVPACFPQNRVGIAIIPLNFVNVSKADAQTLTGLLETGLVQTDIYDVIAQADREKILDAQEATLGDCTDEECAVNIGKLLAAEQIVLGSVSRIGSTYLVNVRIIDVESARTVMADKVEATSPEELARMMDLLAFRLVGLTYREGGKEQIASEYAELFVRTVPDQAEVFLNGVRRGTSPCLVRKVPAGKAVIEARTESLYARSEVDAAARKTVQVTLELKGTYGNLFVKSSEKAATVYLGERELGRLGDGFFGDILVGTYGIEIKGDAVYWKGEATVREGETVEVQAYPRSFGSLQFVLPEGVTADLTGVDLREVLRGSGRLSPLWEGAYRITAEGGAYESYSEEVQIGKGQVVAFEPKLRYTQAYVEHREQVEQQNERERLATLVEDLERSARSDTRVTDSMVAEASQVRLAVQRSRWTFDDLDKRAAASATALTQRRAAQDQADAERAFGERLTALERKQSEASEVTEVLVASADKLVADIRQSRWEFVELVAKASLLSKRIADRKADQERKARISVLEHQRDNLQSRIAQKGRARRAKVGIAIALSGVSIAGVVGGVVSFILGGRVYEQYEAATVTEDADRYRAEVEKWDTGAAVGAGTAGGGLVVSLLLLFTGPRTDTERAQLRETVEELERLGRQP